MPILPATSLEEGCYRCMFLHCGALTVPPIIKAESLAKECCTSMFNGCSNLHIGTTLVVEHDFFTCPETSGIEYPVQYMFEDTAEYPMDPVSGQTYYWFDPI